MTCAYCARPSCRCQVYGQPAERHVRESLPRASRPCGSGNGADAPLTGFRGSEKPAPWIREGYDKPQRKSRAEINRDYRAKK